MIREEKNIRLSPVDEERFTIYDVPTEQVEGPILQMRKTFIWTTAVLIAALVAVTVVGILVQNPWVRLVMFIGGLFVLFMGFSNTEFYRKNTYRMRAHSHYIEIEIMEKLPLETELIGRRHEKKEKWTFFPVRARDTKKRNYTSICYLKKEEYEEVKAGDVIKLRVPLSKDRKNKK